jgi:DNA replication regulator SLD2
VRPAPKPKAPPVQQDQASETDQDSIAETQLQHAPVDNDDDDDVSDADSDTAYSDTEAKRKRQLTKPATTMHDDDATTLTSKDSKSARVVKKAARKIKATAHANFRKLNIKNQNSKAKGGNRFRRK